MTKMLRYTLLALTLCLAVLSPATGALARGHGGHHARAHATHHAVSGYGAISSRTGRARTHYVHGYTRRNGTRVHGYYRS